MESRHSLCVGVSSVWAGLVYMAHAEPKRERRVRGLALASGGARPRQFAREHPCPRALALEYREFSLTLDMATDF